MNNPSPQNPENSREGASQAPSIPELRGLLNSLPPFLARQIERVLANGEPERARALLEQWQKGQNADYVQDEKKTPSVVNDKAPRAQGSILDDPPKTSKSFGVLSYEAEQGTLEHDYHHPLPAPEDDDPRWLQCKRRAVARVKLYSGTKLPFTVSNPRWGDRPGPGAFVALMLALMLYYRDGEAVKRFSVFAPQWAIADVLGVSEDTIQRWQALKEVQRYLHSWRWLDGQYRAGMFYTVYERPDARNRPLRDLLALRLRSLRNDKRVGLTRAQTRPPEAAERLHIGGCLKNRWAVILPLNKASLTQFGELKKLVEYVAAQDECPTRPDRMGWAQDVAESLERHLGLGDDPETRRKLYWKIALTALRAMIYAPDKVTGLEPLRMVKAALRTTMEAQGKFELHNIGAYFTRALKKLDFFDLAKFYSEKAVV